MRITVDALKANDACHYSLKHFTAVFGVGATVTPGAVRIACDRGVDLDGFFCGVAHEDVWDAHIDMYQCFFNNNLDAPLTGQEMDAITLLVIAEELDDLGIKGFYKGGTMTPNS